MSSEENKHVKCICMSSFQTEYTQNRGILKVGGRQLEVIFYCPKLNFGGVLKVGGAMAPIKCIYKLMHCIFYALIVHYYNYFVHMFNTRQNGSNTYHLCCLHIILQFIPHKDYNACVYYCTYMHSRDNYNSWSSDICQAKQHVCQTIMWYGLTNCQIKE